MTDEQKIQQYREFTSMLLSCQLAVEFNKDKPNKAIKHTLKHVKARVQSENIKIICDTGINSVFATGWLAGKLNRISREGDMSKEEFLEIGAVI